MTVTLHAQPYDITATGFYFETAEDFTTKSRALRNDYGEPVEEFEIQFIDGDAIDCALASAFGLHQGNIAQYLEAVEAWDTHGKRVAILALRDCGFDLTPDLHPDEFDIDIYELNSLRELAELFVEDGFFGELREQLQVYVDYDAIARDLGMDYAEATIAGTPLVYRCG
ncbi:antirestriction protein ArdA [Salipiger abyssi]|uniref:antirestriction protein ArdA n=1 Tax=Salipiger abyssi TaxID=1250539 RepID=UPI001A90B9F8|nr:antirestriction protein ArdA [Salipiger abyssi]MBN9890149.1 antirestriction protein ArdA [Salipiger abyssi]